MWEGSDGAYEEEVERVSTYKTSFFLRSCIFSRVMFFNLGNLLITSTLRHPQPISRPHLSFYPLCFPAPLTQHNFHLCTP